MSVNGNKTMKEEKTDSSKSNEEMQKPVNEQLECTDRQAITQPPNDMLTLLQNILAKQDILLDDNKRLKDEMAEQQTTIYSLSLIVESLQEGKKSNQETATYGPPLTRPTTTNTASQASPSLKDQAAKQLQSKRINQLLDSTPFSGSTAQDVSDWIEEFTHKCEQVQLDKDQRLSVMVDLLKGNAKLWYDTHKETIDNWITLKTKLTAYFKLVSGMDSFQLEQDLYNRRRQSNESAIDYFHNVLKLCSKVNKQMDEETRIKHLIKGLNSAAQSHMELRSPITTEEFLKALIKHDKWQEEEKVQQRASTMTDRRTNTPPKANQYPTASQPRHYSEPQRRSAYPQQNYSQYPIRGSNASQYDNNKQQYDACWSCGGNDHYQYNCPKNY